jgi:Flp pilus assembly protein TadG
MLEAGGRSRGSVTAEFAVVLPVLVILLAAVLAAGAAGVAKLRCIDAARSAARLAARHEPSSVALDAARSAGPQGASVQLSTVGELVRVQVTARVRLPLPGRPTVELSAASVAQLEEPGVERPLSSAAIPGAQP